MNQTIAIANDHAAVALKQTLSELLESMGYAVHNLGTDSEDSVDYPDYGHKMADWLKDNPGSKGVLLCGSGIGISIAANRHRHVRAALCSNGHMAALARQHNDANVLCMGARMVNEATAEDCLKQFLATEFEGGRHQRRLDKL